MKMKIRLDFCDFWPGFPKTDNFFYQLLRERFDVQICDRPDFLIYADPGQHIHRVHNCVKIYVAIEVFLPNFRWCDYAFTCHYLDDPRHLRLPYYAWGPPPAGAGTEQEIAQVMASKTRFCGFVVTNAKKKKTHKRVEFFHRLSKYKKVDSGGAAFNNIGRVLPRGLNHKLEFLRPCKFNIAFENGSTPGYTTEKITDAMRAGCASPRSSILKASSIISIFPAKKLSSKKSSNWTGTMPSTWNICASPIFTTTSRMNFSATNGC
jgi:hypothetical protein